MKLHRIATITTVALALTACAGLSKTADPTAELASHLTGYFTSAAQAAADKDFFNIELRIVPVWAERKDGPWLYVEQADARTPDKPYRQRVYRLEFKDGKYLSHIYEFKGDALKHAGQWRQAAPLAALTPADLVLKDGCAVVMDRHTDGSYSGATADKACPSVLRGSRYASSKVTLDAKLLDSWDQGFDAEGKQVWGAMKGAYKFVKISAKP
jgi:CpeT protein